MIKALDNNGKLVLNNSVKPVNECWFVMKNLSSDMVHEYAAIYSVKQTYKCSYDPQIEDTINTMNQNLLVKSCKYP